MNQPKQYLSQRCNLNPRYGPATLYELRNHLPLELIKQQRTGSASNIPVVTTQTAREDPPAGAHERCLLLADTRLGPEGMANLMRAAQQ